MVHARTPEREELWGDLVARGLLAGYAAGVLGSIGDAAIEAECDRAMRAIIGRVDRGKLVDAATRRLEELAGEAGIAVRRGL